MAINRFRFSVNFSGAGTSYNGTILHAVVPPADGTVTDGYDFGYDSGFGIGAYQNFCGMKIVGDTTTFYNIQGVPIPDHKELHPIWLKATNAGNYTLDLYQIENDFLNLYTVLYNAKTDTIWDWNTEGPYVISLDAGTDTYDTLFIMTYVMPPTKEHKQPIEVDGPVFCNTSSDYIKDFPNACATIDYISTFTPKGKEVITTTYDFIIGDRNSQIIFNNGSAISATIPAESVVNFPVHTKIELLNRGAGTVTVGITTDSLNTDLGGLTIPQYAKRTLYKTASANWILTY